MTTDQISIDIKDLAVDVVRKKIKHLYVGVLPPPWPGAGERAVAP